KGGGATAAYTIGENAAEVGLITANDPDAGDTVTFRIAGGDDDDLFEIDGTGQLRFRAAPDYETPDDAGGDHVSEVIVEADDGEATDSQTITVTVTNANEAPIFANLGGTVSFTENLAAVLLDGNATVTDPELAAAGSYAGAKLTLARTGGAV